MKLIAYNLFSMCFTFTCYVLGWAQRLPTWADSFLFAAFFLCAFLTLFEAYLLKQKPRD